jgi:rubrerythrin
MGKVRTGRATALLSEDGETMELRVGVEIDGAAAARVSAVEVPLDDAGFVDFAVAGTAAAGEFRCAECGYGAVVQRVIPSCPMCGGTVWESRGPRRPAA